MKWRAENPHSWNTANCGPPAISQDDNEEKDKVSIPTLTRQRRAREGGAPALRWFQFLDSCLDSDLRRGLHSLSNAGFGEKY